MPKLTALEVRNMKAPCRIGDGQGLFYEVTATGIKRWIYRYKINGKAGKHTIGRYPGLSLEKARKKHIEARELVQKGINPSKARKSEKQKTIDKEKEQQRDKAKSFEHVALDWIKQQRGGWSKPHADAVLKTLQNDVFCEIGTQHVESIKPPEVLKILRIIESRGSLEIANKSSDMFFLLAKIRSIQDCSRESQNCFKRSSDQALTTDNFD